MFSFILRRQRLVPHAESLAKGVAFVLGLGVSLVSVRATELPSSLSKDDIQRIGKIIGAGAMHQAWTAHGQPNPSLGLDVGLESTFLLRRDILTLGNGAGVLPRIVPVPRLWFSWDLPREFIVSGSFAPGMLFDGVTAIGAGLQWKFLVAPEIATHLSSLLSYTAVRAFGDLSSNVFNLSVQASRDLIFWQPYAGFGVNLATASVREELAAPGVGNGAYILPAFTATLGARIDLVAKLAFQLNLVGTSPSFSVLLSHSF